MVNDSLLVEYFPVSLKELSKFIGVDACLKLVDFYGGRRIYVPKTISGDSDLGKIGAEAISYLQREYGGNFLSVPAASSLKKFLRNRDIAEQKKTKSTSRLAQDYDLTERQVWAILKKWRKQNAAALDSQSVA